MKLAKTAIALAMGTLFSVGAFAQTTGSEVQRDVNQQQRIEQGHTGCDAVMIGRGIMSNPWLFRQIAEFDAGRPVPEVTMGDRHRLIKDYFQLLVEERPHGAIGKMKQFACHITTSIPHGKELRETIHHSQTTQEILERVDRFFEKDTEIVKRETVHFGADSSVIWPV